MIDDRRTGCPITEAMIARRAFEIWLVDGSRPPEENWAQAESELREEHGLPTPRPRRTSP
jgi:hypothetical protein